MDFLTGPPANDNERDDAARDEWDDGALADPPPARVFSRAFLMLLGAVALVGLTSIAAVALTRGDRSPLAKAELGGLADFVSEQSDDALMLDIDYSAGDDMTSYESKDFLKRYKQDHEDLKALLDQLGFSPAVHNRMQNTRALDGTQEAEGDKVSVFWTYHPDDGLSLIFERQKD